MKILFITYKNIDYACPRYRAFWPAKGLQMGGHCTRVLLLEECDKKDIDWADVVVFERIVEAMAHEPDHYKRLHRARKIIILWNYALLRKITAYDLDDYIFFSDDGFMFYNICSWLQKALMRYSNYVSTSSAFLASIISNYNKKVFQLNNCIDTMSIRDVPETRGAGERITLGWLCGQTHHRDEPVMLDIIKPLIDKYGQAIRFLFVGKISSKMLYLLDPYSSYIMIENYRNWKLLPALQKHIDINLVPLLQCALNHGKSAISYLEAGFLKIPSVCSRIGEFSTIIKDGDNGFLAATVPEWVDKLGMLIEDATLRREMGERAYRDVMSNYTIHAQGDRYSRFIARMPLPPIAVRLRKSTAANTFFLCKWLQVMFLYLISMIKDGFNSVLGRVMHWVKNQIKKTVLYMSHERRLDCSQITFTRSWHVNGVEEHIFLGLDAINSNVSRMNNDDRIVFEVHAISLNRRIEPFISMANWIAEKGKRVFIVAPKAIRGRLKPYLNPNVILQEQRPKKTKRELHFTQEEFYAIIKKRSPVLVDPYIFSPLVINKMIGFRLGLYAGSRGDAEKVAGEICSYFRDRYRSMQLIVLSSSESSISCSYCKISTVNYQGPECLAQFYSGVDTFLMLDDSADSIQMVLEAMSCGTPVISKPLNANCFEDGYNIIFYDQTRGPSLCACITKVLEDYSYRERLISEGHNCAKQFNPSYNLQYFDRIINEELANEDKVPVTV